MKTVVVLLFLFAVCCIVSPTRVSAQRDYFTPEEIELIRDAQQIDERINILTHAVDRRFAALKINVSGPAISPKDADKWGTLPESTRFDLLFDIKRILQKAIDDIDNLSERPDSIVVDPEDLKDKKKPQGFKEVFPKAVRDLAAAARRYGPALKTELDTTKDEAEKGTLLDAIDSCDEIIAATTKLPADAPQPTGKKH